MKTSLNLAAIFWTGILLAGCAQFQHQTSETEPHGLVTIANSVGTQGPRGEVVTLDGLPVKSGQAYRVRPGGHAVQVDFIESGIESAGPMTYTIYKSGNGPAISNPPANLHLSQSGGMSITGQQPFAVAQPVIISAEERHIRKHTYPLQVKVGRHYQLDGTSVTEGPLPPGR